MVAGHLDAGGGAVEDVPDLVVEVCGHSVERAVELPRPQHRPAARQHTATYNNLIFSCA